MSCGLPQTLSFLYNDLTFSIHGPATASANHVSTACATSPTGHGLSLQCKQIVHR